MLHRLCIVFFFNDTATTEIYTLSLHDALPISYDVAKSTVTISAKVAEVDKALGGSSAGKEATGLNVTTMNQLRAQDRKSTRLNSSHANISYAVFCLKKKKKRTTVENDTKNVSR